MYYAVYDLSLGNYMETGFNNQNKEEVVKDILELLDPEMSEADKVVIDSFTLDEKVSHLEAAHRFVVEESETLYLK